MRAIIHSVRYDRASDVLYISTRPNRAAVSEEGLPGVMWRYDASDGGIVGVTIMDFDHYWSSRISELTVDVAAHLSLPQAKARDILEAAK